MRRHNTGKRLPALILFIATELVLACTPLLGQDDSQLKLAGLRTSINTLEKKIKDQEKKESATLELLDALDHKISLTKSFVSKLKKEIQAQKKRISVMQHQQQALERNLKKLKSNYSDRIVSLYKYGRISTLQLLFDLKSLNQVQVWAQYQRRLSEIDARRIGQIRAERSELEKTTKALAAAMAKQQALLAERKAEGERLDRDRRAKKKLLTRVRKNKETYRQQIRDDQKAIEEILRLIASSEKANAKNDAEEESFSGAADFASLKGHLPWPVVGEIFRKYGPYEHPVLKTITDNLGIDIKVAAGAPVKAVAEGRVTAITWQRGRGNLIIISHRNGYYTVYTHLDEILVNLQERVAAGQQIGVVGETGSLDGPLLHFQIWKKFDHMDPLSWLHN